MCTPPEVPSPVQAHAEIERLTALESYHIMDSAHEAVFDDLTRLAAFLTGSSMAMLSLVGARRQWIKAAVGLSITGMPRDQSFCTHVISGSPELVLVPDTRLDPRFAANPLVAGAPHVRFYAAAPLMTRGGDALGAICVLDRQPRTLTADQQEALATLARTIMTTLELRRVQRQAEELALTEPLTGLSNRRAFFDVVGRAISRQNRDGQAFGLIYLGLGGFDQVNQVSGRTTGDRLLREAGRILQASVRRDDVVTRLEHDRFAVLLAGNDAALTGELVRAAIGQRMHALGWPIEAFVGAVTFRSSPVNEVEVIVAAEQMMAAARATGQSCTRHREVGSSPAPRTAAAAVPAPSATAPAMASGPLDPAAIRTHYQPIVDLRTGQVLGVEALARLWNGHAVLPPAAFLPGLSAAELRVLLFTVLDQGLVALGQCAASHPALTLSINVDPAMLLQEDFTDAILARLEGQPVDHRRITLELLENGEILDQELAGRQLQMLRDSRVRITLDDVGSGYSSLNRLRNLPVDGVKLDQAFVRGVWQRPNDLLFVTNMMSLAHGLGRSFVVEGAETAEILDALSVLGVGPAQGYAIAHPMPGDALPAWLAAHRPTSASHQPSSLLGAYAAHLNVVRATLALTHQPLEVTWLEQAYDPHACLIGRYFDQNGLHDTPYGMAHKRFHAVLSLCKTDKARWEEAAETFRLELEIAIHRAHSGLA